MNPRVAAAALLVAACARPEAVSPPAPLSRAPDIRVGVAPAEASVLLGGSEALVLANSSVGLLAEVPAGRTAVVDVAGGALRLRLEGTVTALGQDVTVSASRSGAPVRLNQREYRGSFLLTHSGVRVTAVNVLDLEDYLPGVLGAELGQRGEAEFAALQAQAVVSRSVALQRAGQWRARGYDLLASVADQVYGGSGAETELAIRAVQSTRGQVLQFRGRVIDAFFHSTCAGRTAAGVEVFAAADRPYLVSVSDLGPDGRAWCAISPRYRWRETWSGEVLTRTLRETLPLAGERSSLAEGLRELRVLERTPSGRVARLELIGSGGNLTVTGPVARALLRPAEAGGALRSADFTLQVGRSGERIVQVVADGAGAGHGVGLCQWGAIGRARAGHSYREILSAYFPGTDLTRTY